MDEKRAQNNHDPIRYRDENDALEVAADLAILENTELDNLSQL